MKRKNLIFIMIILVNLLFTTNVMATELSNAEVTDITTNVTSQVNTIDNSIPKETNMFGLTPTQVLSITYPACIFGVSVSILYIIYLSLKKKFILPRKGYTEEIYEKKKYRINNRIVYMIILAGIFLYYLVTQGQAWSKIL